MIFYYERAYCSLCEYTNHPYALSAHKRAFVCTLLKSRFCVALEMLINNFFNLAGLVDTVILKKACLPTRN